MEPYGRCQVYVSTVVGLDCSENTVLVALYGCTDPTIGRTNPPRHTKARVTDVGAVVYVIVADPVSALPSMNVRSIFSRMIEPAISSVVRCTTDGSGPLAPPGPV